MKEKLFCGNSNQLCKIFLVIFPIDLFQAYNNMGSIYVDIENFELAESCYKKALGIKHTRAHQGLARVFYVTNRKKAAYDEMTKLIEKAKNNASAYEKRSEYCERENAMSDLNTATTLDPLRTYPYRYRAAGELLGFFLVLFTKLLTKQTIGFNK